MKQRIFSGIQPSGVLHLGNYLGAIKNWVALQEKPARNASHSDAGGYDPIFCVVDLHAITVPQKPEQLRQKTLEVAKTYLAAGIDPEKSLIFVQSHVPEHTELAWILNTITKIPELERMTQFKDKSKEFRQHLNAGLFNYPVLMAADILLYDANLVPVGEDQLQHVEIARTLARRFNSLFGQTFVVPERFAVKEGMRIMGLDDPKKKMSKSASSEYNYISLTDTPEIIREKIKKSVTDSGKEIKYSADKPAIKNLINIFALLDNAKPKEIVESYQGKGYAEFKKDLAEVIVGFLEPFQEKYNDIEDREVLRILEEGQAKAKKIAEEKIEEVREKVGLL
ncbi:MAG: tryptophan--tRNA ligase [Candidatus Moranbacteria bacterium RIFOXYB1_FULL_43_19]|nr:MAG: tryptophan--tRNA ligase [Candidatus Moranbacteria bacterium RIFOXYB1_FULL_43_19]OGI28730.1 MAG: tryptophan--tRNA ligase [Candidatus Moranbacteria bacterium RIFOXYA1_FULL_44_7]OGI33107.1 MAG: tryptophan--tRNA ligase [Candidatus Moranbacteria bacterium RIFOXYC1_FULL_44_13]OGI38643.1 MAG: tryptophan--tRNA ligase [Candidatus Moranbacteria bacterium RIFOXYD1_FULL_44_12]